MSTERPQPPVTTSGAVLPTKKVLERALRDAGLTARQSKKLLAAGYRAIADDDGSEELAERLEQLAQTLRGG